MPASLLDGVDLEDVDVLPGDPPEEYDLDPEPAPETTRPRRRRMAEVVKPAGRTIPVATRKRLAAELEAYTELVAMPLVMRDPLCGGALHDQAKPIAEAVAAILARYPDLAAKIIGTSVIADFGKLLIAVKPVAMVVWSHHISKTVEGATGDDPGQPDYSAYPAFRSPR